MKPLGSSCHAGRVASGRSGTLRVGSPRMRHRGAWFRNPFGGSGNCRCVACGQSEMPLTLALAWRRDKTSPLLASFIAVVRRSPDVRALHEG
jgi:hypothetical protein